MSQEAIQTVFGCVVIAKLAYAANAWWGFATAPHQQRVEAVIRWGVLLWIKGYATASCLAAVA